MKRIAFFTTFAKASIFARRISKIQHVYRTVECSIQEDNDFFESGGWFFVEA